MTEKEFKKNAKIIPMNIETEEKIALDYFKYKVLPTTNGTAFESKEEHYTKMVLNVIEKLQKENEDLKLYIQTNPNLNEMSAAEYTTIRKEAYYQGREEEQQKAEQIIYENYIPKDIIREKIKYYEEIVEKGGYSLPFDRNRVDVLKELLEEE